MSSLSCLSKTEGKKTENLFVSSKKKMMKRTQQSARETKQEAKDASKAKSGLFASCSFSSLGLDPKLSDQLQGSLFASADVDILCLCLVSLVFK